MRTCLDCSHESDNWPKMEDCRKNSGKENVPPIFQSYPTPPSTLELRDEIPSTSMTPKRVPMRKVSNSRDCFSVEPINSYFYSPPRASNDALEQRLQKMQHDIESMRDLIQVRGVCCKISAANQQKEIRISTVDTAGFMAKEDFHLPLESVDDLMKIEQQLTNKHSRKSLFTPLSSVGGRTFGGTVRTLQLKVLYANLVKECSL